MKTIAMVLALGMCLVSGVVQAQTDPTGEKPSYCANCETCAKTPACAGVDMSNLPKDVGSSTSTNSSDKDAGAVKQ